MGQHDSSGQEVSKQVSKYGAYRPQKPQGLLGTDGDEFMLNVPRCQLTY